MCYEEGTLQAYLDRELPGRKRWEIEAHIATCNGCRQRLTELEEANAGARQGFLTLSQDLSSKDVAAGRAWQRLTRDDRFGQPVKKKGVFTMLNSRLKKALVPVAVAAAIAVSFSFAPVREAAAGFLKIFRAEKIETINISQKDLQEMRKVGHGGGEVNIENFGKFETSEFKPSEPISFKGAKDAVDFDLALPESVAGYGNAQLTIQYGFTSSFTLDVEKANGLIKSFGGQKLLPATLDGKKFTAKMPTAVIANYPKDTGGMLTVAQSRSPELILPGGVDEEDVRDVLLSLPILPDNVRTQLEAIKDWRHTLPIPSIEGSSKKVTVNGTEGVFTTPPEEVQGGDSVLIWQKDGVISAVTGKITLDEALAIAGSMK